MPTALPEGAPTTLPEAFAHINAVTTPTVLDLKVMVLVEAAGLALYEGVAQAAEDPRVQALLRHNGREEMAHAHRVSKAIKAISGEDFLPPQPEDNPYLSGPMPSTTVTAEGLAKTADAEFAGEMLYERWASSTDNAEAAAIFRLNGK